MESWLNFLVSCMSDMFTYQLGEYSVFQLFLAMSVIGVVASALLLKVRRG